MEGVFPDPNLIAFIPSPTPPFPYCLITFSCIEGINFEAFFASPIFLNTPPVSLSPPSILLVINAVKPLPKAPLNTSPEDICVS